MSFSEEKRVQIKRYICDKIKQNRSDVAKSTSVAFGITLNTVYRYIRDLEKNGIISKNGKKHSLVAVTGLVMLSRSKGELQEEDVIYEKYAKQYIEDLPNNVKRIWQYSFMEMMNNAIDHSEAENVALFFNKTFIDTTILIRDDGVGIFRKIKEYYHYDSLDDAVKELFKGKLTTDKRNHSGEGIFFTSRILDGFAAVSDGKIFTHNNFGEKFENLADIESMKDWEKRKGTTIFMSISNTSTKELKEVFDMFSNADGGFTKTRVPIKNIFESFPVSRSQAKRLCHRFEKFKEVELDFNGVDEIGQAFAHEIFVVFQNNHKDTTLIPINMSKEVEKMINHVRQTNI